MYLKTVAQLVFISFSLYSFPLKLFLLNNNLRSVILNYRSVDLLTTLKGQFSQFFV